MNREAMIKKLADWIEYLKAAAEKDEAFLVSWFRGTEDDDFSIIGGWMPGFSEEYSDILCISKSSPEFAMCVKIASNTNDFTYADFEDFDMPVNKDGEVDNTCIALEWEDDAELTAQFFLSEWERITKEYEER